MSNDLIVKLRLPSKEAADLIESRWGISAENPRCIVYRLGTLYQADGLTPSDGYHVDYLLTGVSDVPQAWRKYMVAPAVPKHALAGRETDAIAHAELAPANMADLPSADLSLLVPTTKEAAEFAGNGRTTDLEDAAARLALRVQIIDKRLALEAARKARDDYNTTIDTAQNVKNQAQSDKTAAQADKAAAQAIIDNPNSTNQEKQAARDAKAAAQVIIDESNIIIKEADDVIAQAQADKIAQQVIMDTLRTELNALKQSRV